MNSDVTINFKDDKRTSWDQVNVGAFFYDDGILYKKLPHVKYIEDSKEANAIRVANEETVLFRETSRVQVVDVVISATRRLR